MKVVKAKVSPADIVPVNAFSKKVATNVTTKEQLLGWIKLFIEDNPSYKSLRNATDFYDKCDRISADFARYLWVKDLIKEPVELVVACGYIGELKDTAASMYKKMKKPFLLKNVRHVAPRFGNLIVDLTGLQFGYPKVRIVLAEEFLKDWAVIKEHATVKKKGKATVHDYQYINLNSKARAAFELYGISE